MMRPVSAAMLPLLAATAILHVYCRNSIEANCSGLVKVASGLLPSSIRTTESSAAPSAARTTCTGVVDRDHAIARRVKTVAVLEQPQHRLQEQAPIVDNRHIAAAWCDAFKPVATALIEEDAQGSEYCLRPNCRSSMPTPEGECMVALLSIRTLPSTPYDRAHASGRHPAQIPLGLTTACDMSNPESTVHAVTDILA